MRFVIVVDKEDHKLRKDAYSLSYRDMFEALINKFDGDEKTWIIYGDCSAQDIEADVILFFDVHSSHHIKIDGIEKHPAIKVEYFNDPHQVEFKGKYKDETPVHKLGVEQRTQRALSRGVSYIVCPYRKGYFDYIVKCAAGQYNFSTLLWYPICPSVNRFENGNIKLVSRKQKILGNGAVWAGDMNCYDFRKWAFNRLQIETIDHVVRDKNVLKGKGYGDFLAQYAGALALCDWYPVPKYFEIPLAGCVSFVQWHEEMEELGFKDGENCICVKKQNFDELAWSFLQDIENYQGIADSGRELIESRYTAEKFAEWFYSEMSSRISGD